jgi:transposase
VADEVRRQAWTDARAVARAEPPRGRGRPRADEPARPGRRQVQAVYRSRYALWKNPENLTAHQQQQLGWIAKTDPRLWRAYLLKEGLRVVFALKGGAGKDALDRWISWARRCRIDAFVALQRRIVKHRPAIDAALDSGLSNALIESTNTKIRVITRVAFGFHSAEAFIALAMLSLGGYPPVLPGRDY